MNLSNRLKPCSWEKLLMVLMAIISQPLLVDSQNASFVRGADGSLLDEVEQSGGIFYDNGEAKDAYAIFRDNGINNIRLKLWHTPEEPYNGLGRVLAMAERAADLGLGITIDFHFSDTWADPGHQTKPAAWDDLSYALLTDSIRQYTRNVIGLLKQQNTLPQYVQIGNEINCGMLWNDGRVCNPYDTEAQWNKLGGLIKNAIQGVKEALLPDENVGIIIHFGDGGNNGACRWFFDHIASQNIDYDIIGLSFYPWWHGTFNILQYNLDDLADRYDKDLMVMETGYPFTLSWNDNTNNIVGLSEQLMEGYPATVDGQYRYIRDLILLVKGTSGGKGKGVFYWSPEWISAPGLGSPWENVALFDFENEVLSSIIAFHENTGVPEPGNEPFGLVSYPNPFHEKTEIRFHLNTPSKVKLSIFDAVGRQVKSWPEKDRPAGLNRIPWHAGGLPPGSYTLHLKVGSAMINRVMLKTE